jgi:hypothetical protein
MNTRLTTYTLILILPALGWFAACFPPRDLGSIHQESLPIKSDYQEDSTRISIVHDVLHDDSVLNLVFVLPVEAHKEKYQYGNGIDECRKLLDSNRVATNVVFIQPDYIRVPWYVNHVSNPEVRQEHYTLEVIDLMKARYAAAAPKVRVFLLGFSKSGWGAMHLLVKHPEAIDGIFIWDAPLATAWNEHWGMRAAFGSEAHFEENYYFMREKDLSYEELKNKRIVVGGYDFFEELSRDFLALLDEKGIAYVHNPTLEYAHRWDRNWIQALLSHGY